VATDWTNPFLVVEIVGELQGVNEGLERAFDQRGSHHREQTVRALTENQHRCYQAFKTSTYEQHKNINPNRVKGTCEWVLKSSQYLRWWDSSCNDLLWISADPGCGKSVLAKSLIDNDLRASASTVSICYFFFKDNDEQNNLATALCAILHQLFGMQPHLLRHAIPSWEKTGDKLQGEVEELWRILMAATSDPASSSTVCVFDALDECRTTDQDQLIQKLENLYTQTYSLTQKNWLKFLVTSRPYDEIQESFRPVTKPFPQIHLHGEEENDQIHEEINLVVKIKVAELAETLKLQLKTRERLEHQLLQMAHRTYLWLYLAIDDIRTTFKNSLRPEEESIRLIPSSVNAAYEKILGRVTSEQVPTARAILQIIVGARRPLTTQEMAIALGVADKPHERTAATAVLSLEGLDEKIRRLCGLFVFINNSKIYLIHQTAREFLIDKKMTGSSDDKWFFEPSDTESLMSQICVNYMLLDDLEDSLSFLTYSAEHWADHVRKMSSLAESKLEKRLDQLYDVTTARFALWFPLFWKTVMEYEGVPKMNAIHLAAFNGHKNVICRLITRDKSKIDQPDNRGTNALQWASLQGHVEVVQTLLEKGADANAQGSGLAGNALRAASLGGHVEVVEILLEKGADANAQDGEASGNALQAASLRGYIKVVETLLEKGADTNAQGGFYGNALQAASAEGYVKVVEILLEKGADANAQGGYYGNALQAASLGGHVEVVEILLEKGADANAQGGFYGNALQAASLRGHVEVMEILLEKGADANIQGGFYGNALQAASEGGHVKVVETLLEKGADANAQGGYYGNALRAASKGGHVNVVEILLEKGADANAQD
jgi:ankyrin repeat protein